MSKDKVVRIIEELAKQKNEEITKELKKFKEKKKTYNGITERELLGLAKLIE